MSRLFKFLLYTLSILLGLYFALQVYFSFWVRLQPPKFQESKLLNESRITLDSNCYTMSNAWLKKSETGLWEVYVSGSPVDRGVAIGKLSKELLAYQETVFFKQIEQMIPSRAFLHFLKYFIYWFNRDIDHYIPQEYLQEIYGMSLFTPPEYEFIGSGYERTLNYHAAHDIGHALQDYKMVGCTSFAAWNACTEDSSLIIGRNFDFYAGDEFSRNKILYFFKPDQGYPFMYVGWAGMLGVVSGMNMKGITVTINAAKSDIPFHACDPISLVAREILQYASSTSEAITIAAKRKTFVSESLLIGSADEKKAIIIEKSPYTTDLVMPEHDYLICSNYFQSKAFEQDPLNIQNKQDGASYDRWLRVAELMQQTPRLDILKTAKILRDTKGRGGKSIGLGNEKSINQLIAHHSVIFQPEKRLVWVSTPPYQLGGYICYDLNRIFTNFVTLNKKVEIYEKNMCIASDPMLLSQEYTDFVRYKRIRSVLQYFSKHPVYTDLGDSTDQFFLRLNPDYFETYLNLGQFYEKNKNPNKALTYYRMSLTKEFEKRSQKQDIENKINHLQNKIK